jgi:hypothetical protein
MNDLFIQDIDGRPNVLFQSDELAAHEYLKTFERVRPLQPERRLMLAVLEDAVMCFQRYLRANGGKEKKLHEDAASWIFDRDDNRAFSFESICEICGLDPDYLRMGLLKWMEQRNSVKASPESVFQADRIATRQWGMRGHKR